MAVTSSITVFFHRDDEDAIALERNTDRRHVLDFGNEITVYLTDAALARVHELTAPPVPSPEVTAGYLATLRAQLTEH